MHRRRAALALALLAAAARPALAQRRAVLRTPTDPFWSARAPDTVTADVETSRGTITVELYRSWAPRGVDRVYNLARAGYFDDSRFYRVVYGFVAQFGIAGDPAIAQLWNGRPLRPDPRQTENVRGTISFAQRSPSTRTTNLFINLRDSPSLDSLHFAPIGRVVAGMDVADSLYTGYGDMTIADPPLGDGQRLYKEGNRYMDRRYPKLDRIVKVTLRPR